MCRSVTGAERAWDDPGVRSVFLFPTSGRDATVAELETVALSDGHGGWVFENLAWLRLQTVSDGLYSDWDEADVADLEGALAEVPGWAIVADISSRASAESLMPLLAAVLGQGGVALDDNSNVPWSLTEIRLGKDASRPYAFAALTR
jgi:hypothetical protein